MLLEKAQKKSYIDTSDDCQLSQQMDRELSSVLTAWNISNTLTSSVTEVQKQRIGLGMQPVALVMLEKIHASVLNVSEYFAGALFGFHSLQKLIYCGSIILKL